MLTPQVVRHFDRFRGRPMIYFAVVTGLYSQAFGSLA